VASRLPLPVALASALALAACGQTSPDLFALSRTGTIPGARLTLVVNDGGVARCNGGRDRSLPSALLLEARDLAGQLPEDARAARRYPPRPGSVLAYRVRSPDGVVRWSDTSRPLPSRYARLAYLARRIAKGVCRLPR
jgi:hypothetical protein